jgi:RNA 2',3'-cyclic 3'-phosphodiesterase
LTANAGVAARRLFFALWPKENARAALADAVAEPVRQCGGRAVPATNLHVTLAFLGRVEEPRLANVRLIGSTLAAAHAEDAPLALRFDRLAHWARAQILCALSSTAAPAVARLAMALQEACVADGFTPDLKPFRAHVTVARKVAGCAARPSLPALVWTFNEFALIESRTVPSGALYSVVESWPLVRAAKANEQARNGA